MFETILQTADGSVPRTFCLKITSLEPKSYENYKAKSQKLQGKYEFLQQNYCGFDPPYCFYCIFMHKYFSNSKNSVISFKEFEKKNFLNAK